MKVQQPHHTTCFLSNSTRTHTSTSFMHYYHSKLIPDASCVGDGHIAPGVACGWRLMLSVSALWLGKIFQFVLIHPPMVMPSAIGITRGSSVLPIWLACLSLSLVYLFIYFIPLVFIISTKWKIMFNWLANVTMHNQSPLWFKQKSHVIQAELEKAINWEPQTWFHGHGVYWVYKSMKYICFQLFINFDTPKHNLRLIISWPQSYTA